METHFFDIVAGILLGDISASYPFIICLDYILQTLIDLIKEIGFTLKNDLVLLANTSTQAEFQLHCLEQTVGGIDLHVNVNKTVHVF